MSNPNKSKRYTDELKQQIVSLVKNGKSPVEVSKEYNIERSTVSRWVKDFAASGSFKAKDNRSNEGMSYLNYVKRINS